MLAVTGYHTTIVQQLKKLIDEPIERIAWDCLDPPIAERYVFAAGILYNKPTQQQSQAEWFVSVTVNFAQVVQHCEDILRRGQPVSICIIGSQSAEQGSFDGTYATCKRAIHAYVRARKVSEGQRINCVAPTIIADSGMTMRRHDYPFVLNERRTVKASEVARLVYKQLYESTESNMIEPC